MAVEFIINESAPDPASFDVLRMRPYRIGDQSYVTVRDEDDNLRAERINDPAFLTKEEWIELDTLVTKRVKKSAPSVDLLIRNKLFVNVPDGLSKTVVDGEPPSASDAGEFHKFKSLPLPIIHKDFKYNPAWRDWTMAGIAARKVGEKAEAMLLESIAKAHGAVRGPHMHHAQRLLSERGFPGPYLEFTLPGNRQAVVQGTPDVLRLFMGLHPMTVQWQNGETRLKTELVGDSRKLTETKPDQPERPGVLFKIMGIVVPQIRLNRAGHSGIFIQE